jgi:hypothetical protein
MLETIIKLLKRFRNEKRGVSNVIVVMLSLILIVIIVGNVVLWSYQMNQLDWEKMKEDITITNVERINRSSWFVAQNEYTVNDGSYISGSYTDTQTVDSQYERFTEALATPLYYPNGYNVLYGTYLSGAVPGSVQTVDSDYFIGRSAGTATSTIAYNPSGYSLLGSTTLVSGTTGDLVSNNGVYMTFRSYASATSAQNLYAHQETTTIGGNSYYLQKLESADATGTTLLASMATTGRQLLGRFVYPLTGISSIPASTWTNFYRVWRGSDPSIAYDAVGSGNNGDGATTISWTHVVGSGTNRFMVIGISIRTVTVSVLSVAVGGQSATFLRSDARGTDVKGEIWYLVNPNSGSKTVTVTLSASSKACGGSVSYTGVAQTSPIDAHNGVSYGGETPSVSLTTTVKNCWIFSNLAISGTATVNAHGSGQVHRYYQVGTGAGPPSRAGDDGDDKPTTTAGSYAMSWTMSWWADVVAQAVAFKPAPPPVGHIDIDILIRQSNGTIRTTIASNVANSGDLTSTATTLSGTYSWAAYPVVDQTDYLEIDYYVEVTTAITGFQAYLRIDDNTLAIADQTRAISIYLPSEYTSEVEFTGSSNTESAWSQLVWTVDSAWTTGTVTVTLQLYNYTLGSYPTSGNGFISYTSSATANTDETKTQTITTNPTHFRDSSGNWKMKVKGVKTTTAQFDFKADWIEFKSTYYSEYTASTEFTFSNMKTKIPTQLNFTVVSEYNIANVSVSIQVWNYSSSAYVTSGEGYLAYTSGGSNETKLLSININPQFYTSNGNAKIKITGVKSTTLQYLQKINQIKLYYKIENRLDINGVYVIDLSTYPLAYIQSVEIQLRYRASDSGEKWYLKAYNWTEATYSDIDFNSTTGHMPTTGWDYYSVNLTTIWNSYVWNNGTIYVQFIDQGQDSISTTIDIDFLGVRAVIDGTRFSFKNDGAITSHLISLWVNNATNHQRYDINLFVNSGENTTYTRADISLPTENFIVKVVTERGNIAVFAKH